MKIIPFDIEKAKSGKYKIQTKDGKNVRIVCWDRKTKTDPGIIALLDEGEYETASLFSNIGENLGANKKLDLVLVDESTPNTRQRIFDIITKTCKDYPSLVYITPLSAVVLSDFIQEKLDLPKWKFIEKGKPIPEISLVMNKEGRLYGLQIEKGTKLDGDFWYLPISEIKNLDYEI